MRRNKFYAHCVKCGAGLRSEKRLENHKYNRCRYKYVWEAERKAKNKEGRQR